MTARRHDGTTACVAKITALLALLASGLEAQAVAITGATVVSVTRDPIPDGVVIMENGKIAAVGPAAVIQIPDGATVVKVPGQFVYPGFINSWTSIGLYEIGSVAGSVDLTELGDWNPHMQAVVAVNAHSEMIPITRVNGVLTAASVPRGGLVSGTAALIALDGWTPYELAIDPRAAVVVNIPTAEADGGRFGFRFFRQQQGGENREQRVERQRREIWEYFATAKSYAERRGRGADIPFDPEMEAMVAVVNGERLTIVTADREDQILKALELADDYSLKLAIYGGDDAWKLADTLAGRSVPVILGSILSNPRTDMPYDAIFANPGVLARAGVKIAFSTGDAANARNLAYHAAMATAFGLDPDDALKALTLWPAQIWGVEDRLGSLERGKDATLFVATGDPLDVRTTVSHIWIRGRAVSLDNRHTRLYEKFRARPMVKQ